MFILMGGFVGGLSAVSIKTSRQAPDTLPDRRPDFSLFPYKPC